MSAPPVNRKRPAPDNGPKEKGETRHVRQREASDTAPNSKAIEPPLSEAATYKINDIYDNQFIFTPNKLKIIFGSDIPKYDSEDTKKLDSYCEKLPAEYKPIEQIDLEHATLNSRAYVRNLLMQDPNFQSVHTINLLSATNYPKESYEEITAGLGIALSDKRTSPYSKQKEKTETTSIPVGSNQHTVFVQRPTPQNQREQTPNNYRNQPNFYMQI